MIQNIAPVTVNTKRKQKLRGLRKMGVPNLPVSGTFDGAMRPPKLPPTSESTVPPGRKRGQGEFPAWLLAAALALATLALYWPAMECGFLNFDDNEYVTDNAQTQKGLAWENIRWAFSTPVSANWHPLTMWSHMLDCQVFGLQPWGHHLTSVLLHALNTALVFLLLRRLLRRRGEAAAPPAGALWLSAFAAALFGWHPLHVESVAWVAERKDVLSTGFFLLALLAYLRFADERIERWRRYRRRKTEKGNPGDGTIFGLLKDTIGHRHKPAEREERMAFGLCLAAFALGLLCKAMVVTLPLVLLLLDYWPLRRFVISDLRSTIFRRLVLEKLPFFALAAAASIVTYAVQDQFQAVAAVESFPLHARAGNALISCCRYLGKFFWPAHLAIYYPLPAYWPGGEILLAGGFLSGVSVWFFRLRNRHPCLLMGWLWFLVTLTPVIGLVKVGGQAMADRYLYIPSIGLLILTLWGADALGRRLPDFFAKKPENSQPPLSGEESGERSAESEEPSNLQSPTSNIEHPVWAATVSLAGVAALVACCVLTRQELAYWKNSETLWKRAIAVTDKNVVAHIFLGNACLLKGQTDAAMLDAAMAEYHEALRLEPKSVLGHVNLGVALFDSKRLDEAVGELQTTLGLDPNNEKAHYFLGLTLMAKGQTDEAINQLHEALRLRPGDADAQRCLAQALKSQSQ